MRRLTEAASGAAAFLTGLMLGAVQFALFFELEARLSSSVTTYLAVVLLWLTGLLVGLAGRVSRRHDLASLGAAAVAPFLLHWVLVMFPFDDRAWLAAVWLVAAGGHAAGAFFQANGRRFRHVRWLLFWENNGFVAGIPTTLLVLTLGSSLRLLLFPIVCFAVILLLRRLGRAAALRGERREAILEQGPVLAHEALQGYSRGAALTRSPAEENRGAVVRGDA